MARRVRILRRALGYGDSQQGAFAARMGWSQPETSTYENGLRPVPPKEILVLHKKVAGIDPLWLTEGRLDYMPPPLRSALEEAEKALKAEEEEENESRALRR
jgi:transcriptional regulator with XRE-family HTH domain